MAKRGLTPGGNMARALAGVLLFFIFIVGMCMVLTDFENAQEYTQVQEGRAKDELMTDYAQVTDKIISNNAEENGRNDTSSDQDSSAVFAEPDLSVCVDKHVYLLLLVFSPPENSGIRQAIRKSWGNQTNTDHSYLTVFVVSSASVTEESSLHKEITEKKDVLLGNFPDSPQQTTEKFVLALKWLARIEHKCRPWFILKSVDGIFHNIRLLMKKLEKSIQQPYNVYRGKMVRNDKPNRNRKHPNHVPVAKYPKERFPDLIQGPLYLFSFDVILRLNAAVRKVHRIAMEDVYVGLLAEKAGILPYNDDSFSLMKKTSNECINVKLLFVYDVSPNDHNKLFHLVKEEQALHRCQTLVEKEGL
ncbi:beta-1,3-galactosyltransferase 9-like [Liolophura sinensis]|uniref:beta-1,3-galactosyltransferase 9-like n=1 Tax=Liolophura sinensis TaxID=3198878 RepID=UPI003159235E